ncbi:reverse transcriptase-like protein [Alkalicoccobacillus murimartini]|uniref:Ribonuclease HI n=1 Tax=Alkalicoccobacillus murimartini TaxID=171685 RepID=A0ABT9YG71_9BACI|nr:reverse transcriptase-like protein [Alkalicoccobacillus murimartini]MDQ0206217.1 ribonuclease HI [Alkalicoccobacillus murimartini]
MQLRLEWQYKPPKSKKSYWMKSESMPAKEALLLEEDLTRTGRMISVDFYDELDDKWTKKEVLTFFKKMETEPQDIVAFIDGGYHRESGTAGLGLSIYYTQNQQRWRYRVNERIEGIDNNNEAEFAALAYLFTICEDVGIHHQSITIRTDSKTLYHQANGDWPCYEKEMVQWLDRVEKNSVKLGLRPQYELIGRQDNKEADQLASQALQSIFIQGKKEQTKNLPGKKVF